MSTACRPPQQLGERGVEPGHGPPVRQHDQRAAPEDRVAATARAISSHHSGPGRAFHTARGLPPEARDSR
ncbi:hypothetical protein DD630_04645 [Streptomyces sp. BSE7F]|nr:hypothetical protein DD630_04645 [Streptomyces sp. BSE7F]